MSVYTEDGNYPEDMKEEDKTHLFIGEREVAARDRIMDDQAVIEHDGRAKTRTGFDPRDSDDPETWQRRLDIQDGKWNRDENPGRAKAVQKRTAMTWCNALEMTTLQEDRVVWLLERIETNLFGTYSYEDIIIGLITIVANEDGRWIRDEEKFRDICRANDLSMKRVRSIRSKMREDKRWKSGTCPL